MSAISASMDRPWCLTRPGLARLCLRAALARPILAATADRVGLAIMLPDGSWLGRVRPAGPGEPPRPVVQLVRPTAVFERLAHNPKIGIGESYMAGDWRPAPGTDLVEVFEPFARRLADAVPPSLLRLRRVVDRAIPRTHRNTPDGAKANIEAHYDLSNDLFAAFLDETLTYSSALFDETTPWETQSLAEAQLAKVHRVLDLAGVDGNHPSGPPQRVLEIGSGWGTLAIEAARRGAQVTTITLSSRQAELARERIAAAGLSDRVEVLLTDYRALTGTWDAIVSVEMIEAVGAEYWPVFAETLHTHLAPGGTAVIQSILMADERLRATAHSYGWIQKYIFPGGLIPSVEALDAAFGAAGLRTISVDRFGAHYAHTLNRWRARFDDNWTTIESLGFDTTFRRVWDYYLAYCEAGFRTGYLDVAHLVLRHDGAPPHPPGSR